MTFIAILIWEFFCYGFYLHLKDVAREEYIAGTNTRKTEEYQVKEFAAFTALYVVMALLPILFLP